MKKSLKFLTLLILLSLMLNLGSFKPNVKAQGPVNIKLGNKYALLFYAKGASDKYFIGNGSWKYEHKTQKFEVYFPPDLYYGEINIDDIQTISFHTNKPLPTDGTHPYNFYLVIYTKKDGNDDKGSWYGYKLISEPYFSENLNAPADEWITWSTDSGINHLRFFDPDTTGYYGSYSDPFLSDIQSGPINWNDYNSNYPTTNIDYGPEKILYISFQTGSAWSNNFDGYLDGIYVTLNNGDQIIIDLENLADEVWVDDDWAESSPGKEVAPGKFFGFNAFATIQDGIDEVIDGGTVNVLQGTYNESVTINKPLSLIGDPGDENPGPGANAPILDGTGFSGKRAFSISNNVTDVTIKGFKVQNFGPNGNTECNGVTAWSQNTANITIEDNYFYKLGYSGILTGNGWGSSQGLHNNWVIRNNIVDTTGAYGFDIENAKNTLISNNIIKNIPWYGINVLSLTTENSANIISENNEISYNNFENVNYYNINLLSWSTNSTATSILRNINVHHNTINSSVSSIIVWKTGSGNISVENITIEYNTININNPTGNGYAINLYNVSGVSKCNHNDINLSGSIGGGGTFFHGINIGESSTETWYIENNILNGNNVGNDSVGIRIRGSLSSTSILNITNNKIFKWSNGIRSDNLVSGIDININYNDIVNNTNYGVLNGSGEIIDAKYNWWGDDTGPYDNKTLPGVPNYNNPYSEVDNVTSYVDYKPYSFDENFNKIGYSI
ncbi:MAG: right-handed parallel beta-helix repeat-containing protein, partial [Caldisericia bacterium]